MSYIANSSLYPPLGSLYSTIGFSNYTLLLSGGATTIVKFTTYIASAAGCTFTLEALASESVGDTFTIVGNGYTWVLNQNASQTIYLLGSNTTTGIGGSITSTSNQQSISCIRTTTGTWIALFASTGMTIV